MIDKQETAVFKLKQNFNKNKEKILQYIKYAENWHMCNLQNDTMCSTPGKSYISRRRNAP